MAAVRRMAVVAAAWRRRAIICFTRALRPSALACAQQHGELSRAGGKQWNRPARRAAWRGEKKRAGGGGLRLEPAPASNQHQHTRGEYFTVSRLSSDSNIRALRRAARSLCKSIWTRHVVLFKQNHVASLDLARVGSGLRDATNPRRNPFWSVPTLVAQAAPVMLMLPPCCVCFSGEILDF